MFRRTCVLAVAALAVASVLGRPTPLPAGEGNPALPFRGSGEGMVTGQVPPNGLTVEIAGTATHLGLFTRTETLFLGPNGTFTGQMVFTAANGDELWVGVEGGFVSPTTATGTYTIAGGTGRFASATGGATFEAFTPDGVQVEVSFDGTIRY